MADVDQRDPAQLDRNQEEHIHLLLRRERCDSEEQGQKKIVCRDVNIDF